MTTLQGEQSTWAKLSAIKSNCGIEVCLDKCLRELEHQGRLAREDEAKKRREAGQPPSRVAEEGAAATGETEGETFVIVFILYLTVWDVEPNVTHSDILA